MAKVSFITMAELKRNTYISGSLDVDKVKQFIDIAQETYVQQYTGTRLFKKLQDLILSGDINLPKNANYLDLLNTHIKPMTIHWTMVEFLPISGYSLGNGGVSRYQSNNAENADTDEISDLTEISRSKAQHFTRRFIDFMVYNQNNFPEYNQNTNDDIYPDFGTSFIGWELN